MTAERIQFAVSIITDTAIMGKLAGEAGMWLIIVLGVVAGVLADSVLLVLICSVTIVWHVGRWLWRRRRGSDAGDTEE